MSDLNRHVMKVSTGVEVLSDKGNDTMNRGDGIRASTSGGIDRDRLTGSREAGADTRFGFARRSRVVTAALLMTACLIGEAAYGRPLPTGMSTTTISYPTSTGQVIASGERDCSGLGPTDATVLVGADNIKAFNSLNEFGRRAVVGGVVGPNESLIAHAFYKTDNNGEYFPGLIEGGDIHLRFENIQFDQPVTVAEDTILLHALWNADQADQLEQFYISIQNHHTAASPYRDSDAFFAAGVFNQFPVPTVQYGDIQPVISGNGTDMISIELTFPYELLRNFEETGQVVPPGLPAPQGFLEPFHFHLEYVVTPEPTSLVLLLSGVLVGLARRRR